jgi:transcriptional regulator
VYLPGRFTETDPAVLRDVIRSHDFATLVAVQDGRFLISHAPLLLDAGREAHGILEGHLALANPMADHLDSHPRVMAVFMGPHAYIPPSWYVERPTVPTWNYVAVYVEGTARPRKDRDDVIDLLHRTTIAHEGPGGWRFEPDSDAGRRLVAGVRAFEIRIERMIGKFKLEQSETPADRESIARGLEGSGDTSHAELARFMREAGRRAT